MTTPHFYLKVGFELSFEFSFCFPFRKGANNCYKPSHKQQAALKKCIFQNPGITLVTTFVENIYENKTTES